MKEAEKQTMPSYDLNFERSTRPNWVVVRVVRYPEKEAQRPDNWVNIAKGCEKLSKIGHFASVAFASTDEESNTGEEAIPLWRDHGAYARHTGLIAATVTREFAHKVASDHLKNHPVEGILGIDKVISAEETTMRLPNLYDPRRKNLVGKSWIAYGKRKAEPGKGSFCSSYVILVAKDTGRIVYDGSAHDEG